MKTVFFFVLSLGIFTACSKSDNQLPLPAETPRNRQAEPLDTIKYGNRDIDISFRLSRGEFLVRSFYNPEDDSLVYLDHSKDGSFLYQMDAKNGVWNFADRKPVFNFGKRSFWVPTFNERNRAFYVVSDEFNNETFNTYRVNLDSGKMDRVTSSQYQPSYDFGAKFETVLSIGRMKKSGNDECLKETSLDGQKSEDLFCNTGDRTIYPFESPSEDPATGLIAFVVSKNADRSTLNLGLIKRGDAAPRVVTDESAKRATLQILGWHDGRLYFISNNGANKPKLNAYSPSEDKTEVILDNQHLATLNGILDVKRGTIFVNGRTEDSKVGTGTFLSLKDKTQTTLDTTAYDLFLAGGWGVIRNNGSVVAPGKLRAEGARLILFEINGTPEVSDRIRIVFERKTDQVPPPSFKARLVEYPTFDKDPKTGEIRQIKAVLFEPVRAAKRKAGIVYAHGGPSGQVTPAGEPTIDFLCSLGYTVLGANPRGSTGQGQEFEDLNNGDWGGGDYKDYEYGRRFLVSSEGIEAERVGIMGGSFGGYMTNWAMTRPDSEFGFGVSDYGMADLLFQLERSVVPDNTKSDMGNPKEKEALYRERSPMFYAHNLKRPFLVTTGSRDFRVYFEDAQNFAKALRKHSDKAEYLELEGEGHGYRYPDTLKKYYSAVADFLYRTAPTE